MVFGSPPIMTDSIHPAHAIPSSYTVRPSSQFARRIPRIARFAPRTVIMGGDPFMTPWVMSMGEDFD